MDLSSSHCFFYTLYFFTKSNSSIMTRKIVLFAYGTAILVPFALVLFFACKKSSHNQPAPPTVDPVILEIADTLESGLVLPAASIVSLIPDHPQSIHVQLPHATRFVGTTATGSSIELQEFDITCNCTSGTKGCSPYYNSRASGCLTSGDCTECKQKNSYQVDGQDMPLAEGAVIDFSQRIRPVLSRSEVSALPPVYDAMLADPGILRSLKLFARQFQVLNLKQVHDSAFSKNLPSGYVYYPINLFGHSMILPIENRLLPSSLSIAPEDKIVASATIGQSGLASGFSCSCTPASDNSCILKSYWFPWLGSTYFCQAKDCLSCTMHLP